MKKIILFISSLLFNINIVFASTLVSEDLPYYVKIIDLGSRTEHIIQVKKVYDIDSSEVVFNINYDNYGVGSNFIKYQEYNESIWTRNESFYNRFFNIVYYGYIKNPSDINYVITQAIIWNKYFDWTAIVLDINGFVISDDLYNEVFKNIENHSVIPNFFNKTYERDLWDIDTFLYDDGVLLDNPDNPAFSFKNDDNNLLIKALYPGHYNLEFSKNYEQESYCFSDGENIYWQSLKGPTSVKANITYDVSAIKFQINENLLSYNNRFGDAVSNDFLYAIYLNDELKYQINNKEEVYLRKNGNYIIKDISINDSFYQLEDIVIDVLESDYVLNITKEVITKNISLEIRTDSNYYVYLKSNDELYEIINKNSDVITLPYGTYYIKDDLDTYYQELVVHDSIDEVLVIEDIKLEENDNVITDDEVITTSIEKNLLINPKTKDSLTFYCLSGIASLFIFFWAYILKKIVIKANN